MPDPLESYWKEIEPPKRRAADVILDTPEDLASMGSLSKWLMDLGIPGKSPILTLPGRGRLALAERLKEDTEGTYATIHVGKDLPRPFVAGLVRNLMQATELSVEGPLRDYADKASHVSHDVYRLLWEGRFLLRENAGEFEEFVTRMAAWIGGEASSGYVKRVILTPATQAAVLCFLTALSAQNGLVKRVVIFYDDVSLIGDRAVAREFMSVLSEVRRWALLTACPMGVLLGFAGARSDVSKLRKLNPTLGAEVETGLTWTKK